MKIAHFTLKSMEPQTLPHTWLSNNFFILKFFISTKGIIFLKNQYFPWANFDLLKEKKL